MAGSLRAGCARAILPALMSACLGAPPLPGIASSIMCTAILCAMLAVRRALDARSTRHIPKGFDQTILMKHVTDDEDILFCAVWVYLMYSAYNDIRNSAQGEWMNPKLRISSNSESVHSTARRDPMTGHTLPLPIKAWVAGCTRLGVLCISSDLSRAAASLSTSTLFLRALGSHSSWMEKKGTLHESYRNLVGIL